MIPSLPGREGRRPGPRRALRRPSLARSGRESPGAAGALFPGPSVLILVLAALPVAGPFGAEARPAASRAQEEETPVAALEALRSTDAFERERAEVELRRRGPETLPALARAAEATGEAVARLRAERIFADILDGFLAELESESRSLALDRRELQDLRDRQEAARLREAVRASLEAWKAEDPDILAKVGSLLRLEGLEEREELQASDEGLRLRAEEAEELSRLRKERESWRAATKDFDARMAPIVRLARLEAGGVAAADLGELELMRAKELEERIAEREPRVAGIVARFESLGFPAWNGALARRATGRERHGAGYDEILARAMERAGGSLVPAEDAIESTRYTRSLLWAWEVERKGPFAGPAGRALDRHVEATLRDRQSSEPLIRDRSAEELYLLGARGLDALESRSGTASPDDRFLLGLLRWRIRPSVYARTGLDFRDYRDLAFRERRQRLFDYARVAGEDAVPTLRAVVREDALESSFFVKLGAAKALAGFRDLSGYNFLLLRHPDMTLKKPEVSRELSIVQGVEFIRDKQYDRAVEELKKVLEEFPFDFRANYHIAFAYLLLRNYPKAIHHFEIAKRIHANDQLTLYNLACAYALSGKKAEAIRALGEAIAAGFDDVEHMEKDSDLDSIRDDPGYKSLIERARSSSSR